MASFLVKTGWKRMRKRENKNYTSVPFLLGRDSIFQKKGKKFIKLKKYHCGFILSQNRLEKVGKERK